jgi:26 proteasome complex subunit DSS1
MTRGSFTDSKKLQVVPINQICVVHKQRMQGVVVLECLKRLIPPPESRLAAVTSSSPSHHHRRQQITPNNKSIIYKPTKHVETHHRLQHNNLHNNLHNPPKMSGAAQASSNTTKAVTSDSKDTSQPLQPQKPGAQLEEDDEFEDFPVEGTCSPFQNLLGPPKLTRIRSTDWTKDEEVGSQAGATHLWEESWDDDDTSDDFSVQLKAELEKAGSAKKS